MQPDRTDWLPFGYSDFRDVPRLIFVRIGDGALILDAPFNDERDEYEDSYAVYALEHAADLSREEWLQTVASRDPDAHIPVAQVEFDQTRRQAIRRSSLETLLG